jgi:hypothetical protein
MDLEHIVYPELISDGKWGCDQVLLDSDVNLIAGTDFDDAGYCLLDLEGGKDVLYTLLGVEIMKQTQKTFDLEQYHHHISDDDHRAILNAMPYKRDRNEAVSSFCDRLESIISKRLKVKVKIFNGDLWFRICRPTASFKHDFNPCHRDVYLDFYRNTVNIYLPLAGSNEHSSLNVHRGSHKWKESETFVTSGGAFFKSTNKKYSVDAIVASKQPLCMIRPNPSETQFMLFSPYLIHGCSANDNADATRISLEVRFIRDDEAAVRQEAAFRNFLTMRTWR